MVWHTISRDENGYISHEAQIINKGYCQRIRKLKEAAYISLTDKCISQASVNFLFWNERLRTSPYIKNKKSLMLYRLLRMESSMCCILFWISWASYAILFCLWLFYGKRDFFPHVKKSIEWINQNVVVTIKATWLKKKVCSLFWDNLGMTLLEIIMENLDLANTFTYIFSWRSGSCTLYCLAAPSWTIWKRRFVCTVVAAFLPCVLWTLSILGFFGC